MPRSSHSRSRFQTCLRRQRPGTAGDRLLTHPSAVRRERRRREQDGSYSRVDHGRDECPSQTASVSFRAQRLGTWVVLAFLRLHPHRQSRDVQRRQLNDHLRVFFTSLLLSIHTWPMKREPCRSLPRAKACDGPNTRVHQQAPMGEPAKRLASCSVRSRSSRSRPMPVRHNSIVGSYDNPLAPQWQGRDWLRAEFAQAASGAYSTTAVMMGCTMSVGYA